MTFYQRLMREMREAILRDEFLAYYERRSESSWRAPTNGNPGRPPKRTPISRPARLGDYEIHRSPQGFISIRQISSGEVMHSVVAPAEEADRLYVEQSFLAARLLTRATAADELVIWDVGLGAAFNAMAAIRCFERCAAADGGAPRPLRVLSFEARSRPAHPRDQEDGLLSAPASRRARAVFSKPGGGVTLPTCAFGNFSKATFAIGSNRRRFPT